MSKGVIYILTNPSFPDYIKIGYAKNLERRLQQLNRSETIPFAFRAYAVYEVESALTDKELHKLIDRLNPDLRSIETFDGRERVKEFYAMSAEDAYSLLEGLHVFVEHLPGKLSVLGCGVHIVLVADLDDEFFKQLFLLARADSLVVIVNHAILACLLFVVAGQRVVKQFVIDGSDVLIAVFDVERRSAGIDVLGDEVPAVVGQRAFATHGGDGSFHEASFLVRGWVTGVLLLLSRVMQKRF